MRLNAFFDKLFSNWQAKVFSFGLAVLLYAAFQIMSLETKILSVPLEVRSDGNYVLTSAVSEFIRVELKGKAEQIATIQDLDIEAYIDISYINKPGRENVVVDLVLSENLILMELLDVKISPDYIRVDVEEKSAAWVPVEPRFAGSPSEGYEVASWESSLSDVQIIGPESIVSSTKSVYADGIDLNDRNGSFRDDATISAISERIEIFPATETSFFVEIVPQIITVEYSNIVPFAETLSGDFAFAEPLPLISLEISGEKNPLSTYVMAENAIEIDCTQITEIGEYTLPVITNIPLSFSLDSINLTEITIEVIEAPLPEEVVEISNLEVSSTNQFPLGEIQE